MSEKYLLYLQPLPSFKESWKCLLKMNCRPLAGNIYYHILYRAIFMYPYLLSGRIKKLYSAKAGINHNTHNLVSLLKEAAFLGRTAVVMPIFLEKMHNFGKLMDSAVDKYYNLEKSYLYAPMSEKTTDTAGTGRKSVNSLHDEKSKMAYGTERKLNYILLEDFIGIGGSFFRRGKIFPHNASISEEENKKYSIIVKCLGEGIATGHRLKEKGYRTFFDASHVHLEHADELVRLAKKIILQIKGEGEKYYFLSIRMIYDKHKLFNEEKVSQDWTRHGHREALRPYYSAEGLCRKMAEFFPPGSVLYIASNLWRPYDGELFSRLKSAYKVYRYYDFPELLPFVEGPAPNTAQLNLVEDMLRERSTEDLQIHYKYGVYFSNRKIC